MERQHEACDYPIAATVTEAVVINEDAELVLSVNHEFAASALMTVLYRQQENVIAEDRDGTPQMYGLDLPAKLRLAGLEAAMQRQLWTARGLEGLYLPPINLWWTPFGGVSVSADPYTICIPERLRQEIDPESLAKFLGVAYPAELTGAAADAEFSRRLALAIGC